MTREEKLEAIYKEMASKERSIGCRINVKYRAYYHGETSGEISYSKEDDLIVGVDGVARNGEIDLSKSDLSEADPNGYIEELETLVEIIGHPVMIGTIFERYSSNRGFINSQFILALVDKWTGYDKSIDEQSEGCIDFVYSLIPKS